jgi:hypothetical protein
MSIAALILFALFAVYSLVRTEFEKYELKRENTQLRSENHTLSEKLAKRPVLIPAQDGEERPAVAQQNVRRGRPGRFQSFGAAKRILESQEPPQRSVNV